MTQGFVQLALFFALIVAVTPLLGGHMARVFRNERTLLEPVVGRSSAPPAACCPSTLRMARTRRPTPAASSSSRSAGGCCSGAVVLVSQGVLQTLGGSVGGLARGPVASQEAIKELGTNGGGFFNVNPAHPFENPTAFSNIFETFLILCVPAALTATFGRMVGSVVRGWAVFCAMSALFIVGVVVVDLAEMHGTRAQHAAGIHTGGNLDGKETRFGIADSALRTAVVTTVTSCGAVNAALESLTAIGGLVPMADLAYGESVFGGVGTGLYTMLLYVLLAVQRRADGRAHARVPGQEIEAPEIKLVGL